MIKNRTKQTLILLGIVLLLTGVFVLIAQRAWRGDLSKKLSEPAKTLSMVKTKETKPIIEKSKKYIFSRDPFEFGGGVSPRRTAEKIEGLVLQGIFEEGGNYSAFISDEFVEVGDEMLGWKVLSISNNTVVLTKAGEKKILKSKD